MRLSILSPSYNYGRFLPDTLASVEQQAGDLLAEHVVADGASTDDSVQVLQGASPHVRWRSEPDEGQSDALNVALGMSTGDWAGWLNVDEFYLPGAFEAVAKVVAAHPDVDVVYGDAVFVDVDGRVVRLLGQHRFSRQVLRSYGTTVISCAAFFRRSALPERGFDRGLRTVMDWDLYLAMEQAGARFLHLPRPLAAFRVHESQVTAEPLPAESPELAVLAERFGMRTGRAGRAAFHAGQTGHRLLKVTSGSYRRELAVRRFAGQDIRWFAAPSARATADRLVAAVTPS